MINLRLSGFYWVKQLIWIVLLAGLCLYLNAFPPFTAVASNSMQPVLSRGDLIITSKVDPGALKVGDVIVFKVPSQIQTRYGYPDTVCHRLVKIQNTAGALSFRTKGDATGIDPFQVSPESIVGKESAAIPLIGYALLFPRTLPGWIFLGGLILLLLIYWNTDQFIKWVKRFRSSTSGIFHSQSPITQNQLEIKMDNMSAEVTQSLNNFSAAMSEYAKHIASHTSAIKSLARVAEHLESVIYQNNNNQTLPISQPSSSFHFQEGPVTEPVRPVEVTPELKAAVKLFILDYCRERNLTTLEMTPELRSAIWEFIQKYVNEPLPGYNSDNAKQDSAVNGVSEEIDSTGPDSNTLAA